MRCTHLARGPESPTHPPRPAGGALARRHEAKAVDRAQCRRSRYLAPTPISTTQSRAGHLRQPPGSGGVLWPATRPPRPGLCRPRIGFCHQMRPHSYPGTAPVGSRQWCDKQAHGSILVPSESSRRAGSDAHHPAAHRTIPASPAAVLSPVVNLYSVSTLYDLIKYPYMY